jgi:ubiquinone/menaquinone biosynthesis C-methylase UbiE
MQNEPQKGSKDMRKDTTAYSFETGNDETERLALEECIKRHRVTQEVSVLITPAGNCELAIKFAQLGAEVIVLDKASAKREVVGRIMANGQGDNITFQEANLAHLPDVLPGKPFDIIVVRRGLCGMPYDEARKVVRKLLLNLKIGGRMYVSILGLHSVVGDGYPHSERVVEQRFSALEPALAKKYEIDHPVCLYSERNLFMLLVDAGASVLRTLTTSYGNVKAIAVRV